MNDYLKLITHPMDLGTVLNKLKRYEYETVAALQADLDLIWDNAIRYNGEDSWMKKYVDHMRAVTSRKLEEAMAEPVRAMPSTAQAAVESFRTADESQVAEALLGFCGDVTVPPEKLSEALAEKERMLVAQDVAAPLQKWFDDHATEDDKSMCVLFTQHAEQVRQVEAKRNEEVAAVRTALNTLRRAEVALANAVSEVSLDSVAEAEAWFYTRVKAHGGMRVRERMPSASRRTGRSQQSISGAHPGVEAKTSAAGNRAGYRAADRTRIALNPECLFPLGRRQRVVMLRECLVLPNGIFVLRSRIGCAVDSACSPLPSRAVP